MTVVTSPLHSLTHGSRGILVNECYRLITSVIVKFVGGDAMEFFTSLSPEECRERLENVVDTRTFTFWPEGHYKGTEVVGTVRTSSFRLRKRLHGRNSFAPVFVGTMRSEGSGTAITARCRPPLFAIIFMLAFPLFAASFIVVGFGWAPILIPIAIASVPFVIYLASRKQASEDRAYLQDFILRALQPSPGPSGVTSLRS